MLLGEQDLLRYASQMFGVSQAELQYKSVGSCNMVDATISPLSSWWSRISLIIRSKPLYDISRIWHLEDKNRLLGVKINGRKPIDIKLFEQVCDFYDIV